MIVSKGIPRAALNVTLPEQQQHHQAASVYSVMLFEANWYIFTMHYGDYTTAILIAFITPILNYTYIIIYNIYIISYKDNMYTIYWL